MARRGWGGGGNWGGLVRFGLPGLILGIVLTAGGRGGGREIWAQGPIPVPGMGPLDRSHVMSASGNPGAASVGSGQADGMIAFAANTGGAAQLLYLIDTRTRAFTIYRVDTMKGTVKLDAARQYGWDMKLTGYNNTGPEVTAIEAMVRAQGQTLNR